jgi:hypothetical protein
MHEQHVSVTAVAGLSPTETAHPHDEQPRLQLLTVLTLDDTDRHSERGVDQSRCQVGERSTHFLEGQLA